MQQLPALRFLATVIVGLWLLLPVTAWPCIDVDIDDDEETDIECSTDSETNVDSGNLTVDHTLAGCRSLG